MKVRQRLGELLNEVQYRGDSILVTKAGLRAAYEGESPEVVADEVDEALASVRGRSSGG
jgi:hypothetical protein